MFTFSIKKWNYAILRRSRAVTATKSNNKCVALARSKLSRGRLWGGPESLSSPAPRAPERACLQACDDSPQAPPPPPPPPVCPRGWVLIEALRWMDSQYLHLTILAWKRFRLGSQLFCRSCQTLTSLLPNLQQERLPAGYDSMPWRLLSYLISKNWNLGKSASYVNLRKRWKVAFVGRGFVC